MEIKRYNHKVFSYMLVGVGGQGVIRAIQILSWAALKEGFKVRTAETHGMAQRGGSVSSYLRFCKDVEGPLIPRGKADIILAFETSEAVRSFTYAGPNTFFFINNKLIIPPMIHQMRREYPKNDEIRKFLKNVSKHIYFINAEELAENVGNSRTMNVVMLGVLMGAEKIPIKKQTLEEAILQFVPKNAQDINKSAFQIGIDNGKSIMRALHD